MYGFALQPAYESDGKYLADVNANAGLSGAGRPIPDFDCTPGLSNVHRPAADCGMFRGSKAK
jgi:hypothetical protein